MNRRAWSVMLGVVFGYASLQGAEPLSRQDDLALRKAYSTVDQMAQSPHAFEIQDLRDRKERAAVDVAYLDSQIQWIRAHQAQDSKAAELAALEKSLAGAREAFQALEKQEEEMVKTRGAQAVPSDVVIPGDVLEVYVTEDAGFNGVYQVRRGGYVVIPQVGRIQVAGYPVAAAEAAVKGSLEVSFLRQATVLVERRASQASLAAPLKEGVLFDGEFVTRRPSVAPIAGVGGASLVSTILREGGTSPFADMENVRVLRLVDGKPLMETVNVDAVLAGDELASDLTLKGDDIVIVPTRVGKTDEVYVTGRVFNPGILPLRKEEEITAYSAILRMGGFQRFANLRKAYVLRDEGDGIKIRMNVDLRSVEKGKAPDLVLQSGDIVVVPEKFFSF
ncbi:MAG: polysaccharide biosynthesis/export family protein [Lentisphaeria bacterium]|nr:polysaccharide biosynthesis/export family protein [Lentisphaeria bacterium]